MDLEKYKNRIPHPGTIQAWDRSHPAPRREAYENALLYGEALHNHEMLKAANAAEIATAHKTHREEYARLHQLFKQDLFKEFRIDKLPEPIQDQVYLYLSESCGFSESSRATIIDRLPYIMDLVEFIYNYARKGK